MTSYTDSHYYEAFIRRAFKCDSNEHKSKNIYFQNLIDTEQGSSSTKHLGSYDKQLMAIKKNIDKAIEKFLKSKPNAVESERLSTLRYSLLQANGTSEIIILLKDGLDATARFRDL